MNLEALRTLCAAGEIMVTQHCMKRMTERNIELSRVVGTVLHGEIVEGKAAELLQSQDLNDQMGLVRGAMLTDYYLRTRDGGTEDQPEVQAEAARIRADWAFRLQNPDEGAVRARAAEYRQLRLPG